MKMGIRVGHAWGMTETSPIGTIGSPPANWDELSFEEQVDLVAKQGRVPFGVELRVVDDEDEVQPRDGKSSGRLQIRGPWVIRRYFQDETRRLHRRGQLVRHRRRRRHPPLRHDADHRPLQGRDQVGRRMDQLGRPRKCRGRLPGRRRGGGDRRQASQMGRAAAAAGRPQGGRRTSAEAEIRDHLERPCRQMVAARRDPVRRQPAAHRHRQAAQDRAARAISGLRSCSAPRELESGYARAPTISLPLPAIARS